MPGSGASRYAMILELDELLDRGEGRAELYERRLLCESNEKLVLSQLPISGLVIERIGDQLYGSFRPTPNAPSESAPTQPEQELRR
jgi:hypothetical protein